MKFNLLLYELNFTSSLAYSTRVRCKRRYCLPSFEIIGFRLYGEKTGDKKKKKNTIIVVYWFSCDSYGPR